MKKPSLLAAAALAGALALLQPAPKDGSNLAHAQSAPPTVEGPGRAVPDEGASHRPAGEPITYNSNPPTSGPHYPTWLRPGIYGESIETGYWVHNLEHGYVVLLYDCPDGCPDLVAQLSQFYESAPPTSPHFNYQKLVVLPYSGLVHPITIVAWDRIDELDTFDPDRLMAFYLAYSNHGPEDAP